MYSMFRFSRNKSELTNLSVWILNFTNIEVSRRNNPINRLHREINMVGYSRNVYGKNRGRSRRFFLENTFYQVPINLS